MIHSFLRVAGSLLRRKENVRGAATGFRPRTREADRLLLVAVVAATAAPSQIVVGLLGEASCSCSLGVGDGDEEQEEREWGDGDRSSRLFGFSGIFGLSLSRSGGLRVMTGLGVPFNIDEDMWGPTT